LVDFFEVGIEGEVLEDVSLGLKTDLNVEGCTLERKSRLVYSLSVEVILGRCGNIFIRHTEDLREIITVEEKKDIKKIRY